MPDQNVFDTATRIAAGDDGKNYDKVVITLHWLTALLVVPTRARQYSRCPERMPPNRRCLTRTPIH